MRGSLTLQFNKLHESGTLCTVLEKNAREAFCNTRGGPEAEGKKWKVEGESGWTMESGKGCGWVGAKCVYLMHD